MKKSILSILIIGCLVSCSKVKMTEAEKERQEWVASFNDSVEYYQNRQREIEQQFGNASSKISSLLQDFEMVKNPKEVSGYYILKGWKSKIPFTTTGIYARINENEKLELIATLAGSTFNRLGIGVGTSEAFSETVPHDQAFNYRHERFNTVYFSGGKADTIAEYIASHVKDKLNLEFIEGNRKKNFTLPSDEKEMIAKTWELYHNQRETKQYQKELWLCSKKIETFRRLMYMEE